MLLRAPIPRFARRPALLIAALAVALPPSALAQVRVRTETIRPGAATAPPTMNQFVPPVPDAGGNAGANTGEAAGATASEAAPSAAAIAPPPAQEIPADPARLPAAVAETRARIRAAAATGDLATLGNLMQASGRATTFSHTQRQDPIAYWKELYPDSGGVEILSILTSILDAPPAHLNIGTAQDIYVWPYFARLPIAALTPAQKVELFRVVTGFDYRGMLERGRYVFYQVGITPDGGWRYFLASDE